MPDPGALILLVEDDPNDALITQKSLGNAGITNPITHVRDGEEAIRYLAGDPPFHKRDAAPLPVLILLDLKMPKHSGFEVLEWIQTRPDIAKIPVIVLTGSIYAEDRSRAQKLGAVGYEIKPVDADELVAIGNNIRVKLLSVSPGL